MNERERAFFEVGEQAGTKQERERVLQVLRKTIEAPQAHPDLAWGLVKQIAVALGYEIEECP